MRRDALRRYPALGFLAVAAVLAVALPSALTLPNAGPPTLAEFAPVPGQGQDAGGDLGRLGSGSSGGLGFGAGSGGGAVPPIDPGQPGGTRKRCVGNPPRQTEDPLSPPCVAFFDGDNGGAVARGVTGDEIRIVIHMGTNPNAQELVDYEDPDAHHTYQADRDLETVVRAYARYFYDRYQTYGRRVHVWGYSGRGLEQAQIRAQIGEIIDKVDPFAIVPISVGRVTSIAKEAAARGPLSLTYSGLDRRDQRRLAPQLLSYSPDLQDQARIAASFVCRKLKGGDARFSGNATDLSRERVFGLLWEKNVNVPEFKLLKNLMRAELDQQCGLRDLAEEAADASQADDRATSIAGLRTAGVTTIIAFGQSGAPLLWGNAAQAQGYTPEWVFPGEALDHISDDATLARLYPQSVWAHAFGLRFDYRRGAPERQHWWLALHEACPECPEPADVRAAKAYDALQLLLWGIQAAGPRLTAENIDQGLHAIGARASRDPSVPAHYFAPGNYSWVKDAMAVWWDAAGSEPGGNTGCYRMARAGLRFRMGAWPRGDDDLFVPSAPCQGPSRPL